MVIPVKGPAAKSPTHALAEKSIEEAFRKYTNDVEVEMVSDHKCRVFVPAQFVSRIIGKQGENINRIEEKLGVSIDVEELEERQKSSSGPDSSNIIPFDTKISKSAVMILLDERHKNKDVHIYVGGDYLLSAKASKGGVIKIKKNNKIGRILINAVQSGEDLKVLG